MPKLETKSPTRLWANIKPSKRIQRLDTKEFLLKGENLQKKEDASELPSLPPLTKPMNRKSMMTEKQTIEKETDERPIKLEKKSKGH